MKVLFTTLLSMLIPVTQAVAAGGGGGEGLSLLTMLFIGFGAMIIVFQLVPAVILLCGMIKGLVTPKETAVAGSSDKKS